jgi:hypothetical protein
MEGSNVGDDYIEIANEFSLTRVRKVHTHNGERLEIFAPKQNQKILLDPLELESLTWQTTELFDKLLTTPFGPEVEYE